MDDLRKKVERMEYHLELLLKNVKIEEYPFDVLIMREKWDKDSVDKILEVCEYMSKEIKNQKAEGFVSFPSLITLLEKTIPTNVPTIKVMEAMIQQNVHAPLMKELLHTITKRK
ncbi:MULTISPECIES: DUF1878 family protein [Bacillus]|uniref:DUF1878 family protein n=1 Tax=Bacillus TaxID=1386 RepID=UPI000BB83B0A|nr:MULTISPECIES: DUF1878 family protein [Bacillus]